MSLVYLPLFTEQVYGMPDLREEFRAEDVLTDIVGRVNGCALKRIYTYTGEAGSHAPIYYEETHLFKQMLKEVGIACQVVEVSDEEFAPEAWDPKSSLLHIPGAMSSELDKHIGNKVEAIRKFVMDGGSFIGWCGGAYWACAEVNYLVSEAETMVKNRELALWKGKEVGPLIPYLGNPEGNIGFFHGAVKIHWVGSEALKRYYPEGFKVNVLLSGGGSFIPSAEEHPHAVIGTYDEYPETPVAAVKSFVGEGISVLVNPYFTHGADYFRPGLELYKKHFPGHPWDRIVADLTGNDMARRICFADMLLQAAQK